MVRTHGQRRLLSATRLGVLLLGLIAAVGLAIAAVSVTPSWSPVPRSPLPDSPSASVGEQTVVRERAEPVRSSSDMAQREDPVVEGVSGEDVPVPPPVLEAERPSSPASAQPGVVVSAPTPPERGASAPGDGDDPSAPAASPAPEPTPPAPAPAPSPEVEIPPEAPPPPEAVVSTHPGQGNAYGKGNGNGPPGGVPPGHAGH